MVHPARMLAARQVVLQVGLAGGGYATCRAEELQCHIQGMFAAIDVSHTIARNGSEERVRKRFVPCDRGKAMFAARKTKEGKAREAKKDSKDEKIAKRKQ